MKSLLLVVDDWEKLERFEDEWRHSFQITDAPFASEGITALKASTFDYILVDLIFGDHSAIEFLSEIDLPRVTAQTKRIFWLLTDEEESSIRDVPGLDFSKNVIILKSIGWARIQGELKKHFET